MLVRRLSIFARLLAVCLVLAASTARAQTVTLAEPIAAPDALAEVISHGSQLELERKWAEALSYYEEALRQHPQQVKLQERVANTRAHYEVCRRYNDPSFGTALAILSDRDAAAIYDEVLLKVQSHYVHEPQWQKIIISGQTCMQVAVTEPLFVSKNLSSVPVDQLAALQRDV